MASLFPHRNKCGSWACPACARNMAKRLLPRLDQAVVNLKARGEKFIMATFTVNRTLFESPAAAFSELRRGSVRQAVERWARGRGLKSPPFLKKLELQDSGWPHWHVLIVVPENLKIRLPYAPRGITGEFDEAWPYGFSNCRRDGEFNDYASKSAFCGYALKEAGPHGESALEAAGLPAYGVHFLHPTHGFWQYVGVEPPHVADATDFSDETVTDDQGRTEGPAVGEPPASTGTLFDRVSVCGFTSTLVIEGGMQDESGEGSRTGTISVHLPVKRSTLGSMLEQFYGVEGCEYFDDSPIVESVRDVRAQSVLEFFGWFASESGVVSPDEGAALVEKVRTGLGYSPPPSPVGRLPFPAGYGWQPGIRLPSSA